MPKSVFVAFLVSSFSLSLFFSSLFLLIPCCFMTSWNPKTAHQMRLQAFLAVFLACFLRKKCGFLHVLAFFLASAETPPFVQINVFCRLGSEARQEIRNTWLQLEVAATSHVSHLASSALWLKTKKVGGSTLARNSCRYRGIKIQVEVFKRA